MLLNMCDQLLKAAEAHKPKPEPIPFALPDITEREIEAVTKAMRANWITTGPVTAAFEQELTEYIGRPTLALNSATAGLHLALLSLDLQPGDEVIVPAMTFVASVETIVSAGGTPVLCDVDPKTQNTTLELIRKKVSSKTRAVVLVHFAGQPANTAEVFGWCDRYGIKVIEDAAHAFGARGVGKFPTYATVWSFYATKCITTAEGGAISTHHEDLLKFVRCNRLHGIDRPVFGRYTSKTPAWEYDVVDYGWKYNMTDMAAAMGRVQLERNEQMLMRRLVIASLYDAVLPRTKLSPVWQSSDSVCHLYPARVERRDAFIQHMFEHGVGVSVHFKPIYRLSAYKALGRPEDFPGVESYWPYAVSLPLYSKMTNEQVGRVLRAVEEFA